MMCEGVESFVERFLELYGNRSAVVAIVHTGSSTTKPLDRCLDMDLVALVDNDGLEGDLFFFHQSVRVDVIVVCKDKVVERVREDLRFNKKVLGTMVRDGSTVYGDEFVHATLRDDICEHFAAGETPFVPRTEIGFLTNAFLHALKRPLPHLDAISVTIGCLEFMGKIDGPLQGGHYCSPKQYLRLLENAGTQTLESALLEGFLHGLQGKTSELAQALEKWAEHHALRMEQVSKLLRPTPESIKRTPSATPASLGCAA